MADLDNRQRLFLVMGTLFHKARNYLDEQLKVFDLNRNEWLILAVLRTHPDGVSQKFIKTYLGVEVSYLTKVLNKLEDRGLILREIDKTDRRNRIIQPGKAAKPELKKIYSIIARLNKAVLSDLADNELDQVYESLALIDNKLDDL